MSKSEIRWYKGKWKVRIVKRSEVKGKHRPRNMMVETLEEIPVATLVHEKESSTRACIGVGSQFTTVPRLLWRHPRK